jgi:hypothetical protein
MRWARRPTRNKWQQRTLWVLEQSRAEEVSALADGRFRSTGMGRWRNDAVIPSSELRHMAAQRSPFSTLVHLATGARNSPGLISSSAISR